MQLNCEDLIDGLAITAIVITFLCIASQHMCWSHWAVLLLDEEGKCVIHGVNKCLLSLNHQWNGPDRLSDH